jgi:hypothetical protein
MRMQRIEAEQRRRNELRDGYAKLKDALPVSTEKSSKVALLDRGMQFSFYISPVFHCFTSYAPHIRAIDEEKGFEGADHQSGR